MMKYIFCVIALLIQPVFSFVVYRKQNKDEAALKMPLVYFSGVYLVVQLFVFIKYLRHFTGDAQKYAYLIQAGILIVFLVLEFIILSSNIYIKWVDKQEKESVSSYKQILDAVQIELVMVTDEQKKDKLNKLYDFMRTQNPVTHEAAQMETEAIKNAISGISSIHDEQEFDTKCEQIRKLVQIRTIKNK